MEERWERREGREGGKKGGKGEEAEAGHLSSSTFFSSYAGSLADISDLA